MKNLITTIALTICLSLNAQERWVLKSEKLVKPDTVLIFKPKAYSVKQKHPLVYLLHGYSQNYSQWSGITNLQKLSDQYGFIIVTPDGFTTFYMDSPTKQHSRYEDFFFNELVPKVHRCFNIDRENIFISGLSMGGYGALRLFILHPHYFNTAGSTSGALEIDRESFGKVSQHFWQNNRLVDDLGSILEGDWHRYSISRLLRQNQPFKKPFVFDCGRQDILFPDSEKMKVLTDSLNIPATFISQPGDHNTEYWGKSIEYHFVYFKQHLKE